MPFPPWMPLYYHVSTVSMHGQKRVFFRKLQEKIGIQKYTIMYVQYKVIVRTHKSPSLHLALLSVFQAWCCSSTQYPFQPGGTCRSSQNFDATCDAVHQYDKIFIGETTAMNEQPKF